MSAVDIRESVARLPLFDTHSHMAGMDTGGPVDDRHERSLAQVLFHDYLAYLAWTPMLSPTVAEPELPDKLDKQP